MKNKIIAMRIENEEKSMVDILRKKYFVNISELFRNTIREAFKNKEKSVNNE